MNQDDFKTRIFKLHLAMFLVYTFIVVAWSSIGALLLLYVKIRR